MNAQELRNLQEAYMEVYKLDEDWKPVNVSRVKSRMGNLEGRLSSVSNDRFSHNTPEYVRYQRTADVVSQSTRNPNKPFQKPTFEPGGLRAKPGGGVTRSPERNPQWEPFSSRLPKTNEPSTSKSSPPTQPKPKVANQFTNRLTTGRSGNGTFSDKSGDYRADLRRRGSSSRGRGGGSSSLSNVGSGSGSSHLTKDGRFRMNVGHQPGDRYGISGIGLADEYDIYDIILSHLLDEGYAETPEAAEVIMVNMSEEWREDIMEREDSPYEKASDAALDARYGYGRATGDKRSFGRAANRSSAAAALRAIRRGQRSGSGTSREAGADAVHQGWAHTARTSADQTPEKKERRAKLADTPYSQLPDDEKEKDRVSFDAVRAVYNRNRGR